MPIFIGTGSKAKAMLYAGVTGFAEPLGALIGYAIFKDTDPSEGSGPQMVFGFLFGITAGIMVEVALKSLLLEAVRYDPSDKIVSKVSSPSIKAVYYVLYSGMDIWRVGDCSFPSCNQIEWR